MNTERNQDRTSEEPQQKEQQEQKRHLNPFKETSQKDEEGATTSEEEIELEQERKEAMTERD